MILACTNMRDLPPLFPTLEKAFRTGPMKDTAGSGIPAHAREVALRWLPPIPENLDNLDDLPATIRPVV